MSAGIHSESATATATRGFPHYSWIAYYDEEGEEARAVCLELGFLVNRAHLEDAVDELLRLTADYLGEHKGEEASTIKRPMPSEAWEPHVLKFAQQCSANPESQSTLWDCGAIHL